VDEGLPIAYPVLERDVPCYASGGETVGRVDHVVCAAEEDIFHGIVLNTPAGTRFVAAEHIASLHERGVDLRIDATEAAALPEPHGAAPAWRVNEPGVKSSGWTHLMDKLRFHDARRGGWDEQE
jgi:hypothetical protein